MKEFQGYHKCSLDSHFILQKKKNFLKALIKAIDIIYPILMQSRTPKSQFVLPGVGVMLAAVNVYRMDQVH